VRTAGECAGNCVQQCRGQDIVGCRHRDVPCAEKDTGHCHGHPGTCEILDETQKQVTGQDFGVRITAVSAVTATVATDSFERVSEIAPVAYNMKTTVVGIAKPITTP
jgi:hypothetical protein